MRNACQTVAKMPFARYKKVHELICMQLFQGIVRGQPDCECKEGCKGDPLSKCDCSSNDGNFQFFSNWVHQLKVYHPRWTPHKRRLLYKVLNLQPHPPTPETQNGQCDFWYCWLFFLQKSWIFSYCFTFDLFAVRLSLFLLLKIGVHFEVLLQYKSWFYLSNLWLEFNF